MQLSGELFESCEEAIKFNFLNLCAVENVLYESAVKPQESSKKPIQETSY
jgi:hypothetical protein